MKLKKRSIGIFICFSCLIFASTFSQTVEYSYDANGNRTQRKLVVIGPNPNRIIPIVSKTDTVPILPEADAGTIQLAMNYGVSVFPNPTQNNINLSMFKLPENASTVVSLLDNTGKTLQIIHNPKKQEELLLQDQKVGIYYVSVVINGKHKLFYIVIKQ